jgi:hypothetical protein
MTVSKAKSAQSCNLSALITVDVKIYHTHHAGVLKSLLGKGILFYASHNTNCRYILAC